ncbi:MAG: LysE family translocator [Cyclobacteriaceae bacterium]
MIWAILEGIGMGLVLSLIIGPVFFALIQNSLENGFRHSFFMALGILLSDSIFVIITYFGISFLIGNTAFKVILGYVGGMILVGIGWATWRARTMREPLSGNSGTARKRKGFFKGLGLNGINPFVFLFWISVAGLVNLKSSFDTMDKAFYYMALLITVFSFDLFKAYMAQSLRRHITASLMLKMNRTVGILLIIFGIRMLYFAFQQHQIIL